MFLLYRSLILTLSECSIRKKNTCNYHVDHYKFRGLNYCFLKKNGDYEKATLPKKTTTTKNTHNKT